MTFSIGVAAEVLALMVVGPLIDSVGRHNVVSLGQLLGGAACLACAMVHGGATQAALAACGKFGCASAEAVIALYTAELLPTSCRSGVMGLCSSASRVGSIVAPFLLMLGSQMGPVGGRSQVFIPFLVFGCLALLSGLFTMLMPETLGADMPETMDDMEQLLSAFTARPWRQGVGSMMAFVFRARAAPRRAAAAAGGVPDDAGASGGQQDSSSTNDDVATVHICVTRGPAAAAAKAVAGCTDAGNEEDALPHAGPVT